MKIRALERTDLPNIHKINNHRATMAYWFEEPYESLDELTILYDKHIRDSHERRFVIELNDEFVGIVELMDIDYIHRNCEIQIVIITKFRGQGLATEALRKGIEYAFLMLNMHKVYLYVDVDNLPAVHIYKKCGFIIEGTMRDQFFSNGEYHDSYFMGLLKNEYEKIEEKHE
ncbi:GNAT family N-acetyltransferase [Floricoccus penangensis]|uniref:Spermidine acetyltransferase n=1 Tax=Floricoccus penangensis TaxID=1859475 RepID=A0A9Q5NYR7_9LACT|nr:GNAT family N-acetyltransferase [Floricoccus penangensis]OFI45808.1 spermidine acetyltransferase [Floricoccus penangensis]URZ88013.1 GNAT family N-acetyltransferase [Floricoccus penangensis]